MSNVNKIYNNYCFVKFLLKYNKDNKDIVVKLYIFNSDILIIIIIGSLLMRVLNILFLVFNYYME